MKLTSSFGPDIDEPTPQDVTDAVRTMAAQEGAFIILERGEDAFLQAAGEGDEFIVEYRDSPDGPQFQTTRTQSLNETIQLLEWCAANNDQWRTAVEWREYEVPRRAGCMSRAACLALIVGFISSW